MQALSLAGCWHLRLNIHRDARGSFIKPFAQDEFARAGLRTDFVEDYFSVSQKGVIRGMHLQRPPHQHAKLVYCSQGAVLDVLLDLREGSTTYGQSTSLQLGQAPDADWLDAVYVCEGVAHGFAALSDGATLHYKVTSLHHPAAEDGVRWDSFGFAWPRFGFEPIVSARDAALTRLRDFAAVG